MSLEETLADYEDLRREDTLAVLALAVSLSRGKRFEALAART